ncbi:MAG: acetate--CoA ligase [Sulfurospirillaceae bacterium]|nr:acetate--CoA ligase [Sulfurospirillaceae bacterium]MDD3463475.1 acetate--CoA ligase [Sulfurospirillaceae bacterium]
MSQVFEPNRALSREAKVKNMCEYKELCLQADEDYEGYWDKLAKEKIDWIEPYTRVLNEDNAPFYKWFEGGKLNVTHNCLGRHLKTRKNKVAIIFEGELGEKRNITYLQLFYRVNRMANLLKNQFGIKKGDRVVLYMPMIPEAVFAMLACAKIGAIHSVVFGGFSADALRDRIIDAQAKLVITADGAYRRGQPYMLKPVVDKALEGEGVECCKKVLIVQRNFQDIDYVAGRDYVYNEMVKNESQYCDPEPMDSEDPLFLLYTSGSTGKPKGVQHSCAGYILWAQYTMEHVFDVKENDTFWCTADVGWITGHTYIVYGPLAIGATMLMYEGVPTFPHAGRWWSMIEEHRVNQFYTAPTAIRLLHKQGADEPSKYDLSSLKILGTVGEPINPDAWMWYYNEIGGGRCPIVDTWWQTETGGHMITPLPGATPIKPGSATFPLPGIKAEIIDEHGHPVPQGEKGFLCITKPWPSMIRTIWGDPDRYIKSYFGDCKKDGKPVYFSGDGAMYDEDGYIVITGRTDDVINVSGHRLGTAEIEAVLGHHQNVAEVAVVGRPDEIKGEGIFAYIVLKGKDTISEEVYMIQELNKLIVKEIGNIAKLDAIRFVPGLPKTRSGKIMRRILRSIAKKEPITQDISTLEDPSIVEKIQNLVHA